MVHRFVVAICVLGLSLGVADAQDEEEDYREIEIPGWRLDSTEETKLSRFKELQEQLGQKGQSPSEEHGGTPHRPQNQPQPASISLSVLRAPKVAKKAYQRAFDEFKKAKPDLAKVRADLSKAVDEFPEMAPAWELLGWLATREQKPGEARRMFLKSIEADGRYQNGYIALARTATDRGRWQEAVQWSEKAVALDPTTSRAHFYWAIASFQLGDLDAAAREATNSLESAYPFMPAHAHQLLGAVHHQRDDFKSAAEEYRIFVHAHPNHPLTAALVQHLNEWETTGVVAANRPAKGPL